MNEITKMRDELEVRAKGAGRTGYRRGQEETATGGGVGERQSISKKDMVN